MFNGRSFSTLGGGTMLAATPSCPAPSFYRDGWVNGNPVPPTPCLCVQQCTSEIAFGDGLWWTLAQSDAPAVWRGKVAYWYITESATMYFTE